MSDYETRNSGWATFGKISLGALVLGALGTGIGFGVKAIYDNGYRHGANATARQANNEATRRIEDLTSNGLILPEEGCWRYLQSDSTFPLLRCITNNGTYTVHMNENDPLRDFKDLTYVNGNTKTVVTNSSRYGDNRLTIDTYVTKVESQ